MSDTLVQVEHLQQYFPAGGYGKNKKYIQAVDDVSFTIERGETLGLVGESGCGKTTTGRTLLRLYEPTGGRFIYDGETVFDVEKKIFAPMLPYRKKMQIVFQDPFASLNPRMSISEIIGEPLHIHNICKGAELQKRVEELMDTVGRAQRFASSYPHELDGGRRQRIGIARALALEPQFIVCDEPVSALDVSIQAQILNLMQDLQEERKLTYMFITHDLSGVKHISNEIMVMYLGMVVEKSESDELFENTLHPYSKALLAAIPEPTLKARRDHALLRGEITSPVNPKPGCRFAARCPYAKERCFQQSPALEEIMENHFVACHYVREINGL